MKFWHALPLALAGLGAAQSDQSLEDVLGGQDSLSTLVGLLRTRSRLNDVLSNASNITILAPNNAALRTLLRNNELVSDPGLVEALLSYHVLNGTYYASNFSDTPTFATSLLRNAKYANVTGGQALEGVTNNDTVSFYSGLRSESNVTEANLNFTGGVVHIINRPLMLPESIGDTASAANLTALAGAVEEADLGEALTTARNVTIFAPNNAAFAAIGSVLGDIDSSDLADVLKYHVVEGPVGYSSGLKNGSLESLEGGDLRVTIVDGNVYVNQARVIIPDVLVANGVVHVIDSVLNPSAKASYNPSTTTAAFSGAKTAAGGAVPFTSGQPTPTVTATGITEAPAQTTQETTTSGVSTDSTGGVVSSSTSEQAAPVKTAAVALGALLGGAVVGVNW